MFKSKTLVILVATLLSVAVPFAVVQAEEQTKTYGTVLVQDDQGTSDSLAFNLTDIAPAPEGSHYEASLVSDDRTKTLNVGKLAVNQAVVQGVVQSTGTVEQTFDSSSEGYDGSNLISTYSNIIVTEEPAGVVKYSSALSSEAVPSIRKAESDIASLNEKLATASTAAGLAKLQTDITVLNTYVTDVKNAVDEALPLTDSIGNHANAAVKAAPKDASIISEGATLDSDIANVLSLLNSISTGVSNIENTTNITLAGIYVDKIIAELSAATIGWDANNDGNYEHRGTAQALLSAQGMAIFNLVSGDLPELAKEEASTPVPTVVPTPSPTPTPDVSEEEVEEISEEEQSVLGLGLPSVGDTTMRGVIPILALLGIFMMGAGALILKGREGNR